MGSLMTILRELARHKLDLVGVQEVRWEGSGTEPAGEYTFIYGKGKENHELGTGFFVHQQLRGLSLLVIGCHNTKRSLVSYHCSEHSCSNRR
jgi:hypothetical protein